MKIITTLLLFFATLTMTAQNAYLQKDTNAFQEEATQLTDQYNAELVMRAKQELLFREKVEEHMIWAAEIKSKYSGKAMLDKLLENQQRETLAMQNILTQPQYRLYKKIKPRLQPLATVEK